MRKFIIFMTSLLVIVVAIFAVIYGALTLVIRNEFVQIEDAAARQGVDRVVDSLNERIVQLGVKSSDWAAWDDTYRFIQDKNQTYIDSNLASASLSGLDLSYMLYFDTQGRLVYMKDTNPVADSAANHDELMRFFQPSSTLLAASGAPASGILRMSGNPLLFFARPILKSDGGGPVRGTIVFAHYLTSSDVGQLSSLTHLSVSMYRNDSTSLPSSVVSLLPQLSTRDATVLHTSDKQLEVYRMVADSTGRPYLIMGVSEPRSTYLSAQKAISYFLGIVGVIIIIAVAIILIIFRQVMARDKIIKLKEVRSGSSRLKKTKAPALVLVFQRATSMINRPT